MSQIVNPYAPTAVDEEPPKLRREPVEDEFARSSLTRTAVRWLVVCTISAVPSFMFGMMITGGQFAGMVTGILIFVVGYTFLDYRTAEAPFRRNKMIRRTLRITYGTRIAISILIPVGAYIDVICGILAVGAVQGTLGVQLEGMGRGGAVQSSFGLALLTTLVQGVLLNIVLALYAGALLGLQWLFGVLTRPPNVPTR